MIQLSELQTMLDSMDRAIFSGTRRVQFTDRAVDYNSIDDMRKARADLAAMINAATTSVPSSFTLATHSRD
jgi:hypothetical protein